MLRSLHDINDKGHLENDFLKFCNSWKQWRTNHPFSKFKFTSILVNIIISNQSSKPTFISPLSKILLLNRRYAQTSFIFSLSKNNYRKEAACNWRNCMESEKKVRIILQRKGYQLLFRGLTIAPLYLPRSRHTCNTCLWSTRRVTQKSLSYKFHYCIMKCVYWIE